jgi:AcrR family transcriptional regulator
VTSTASRPRRRADAERSIARIVAAARERLGRDPEASIDDIAKAAGVGRMTLYGHFRTRADLVEAALIDTLRAGDEVLSAVDLTGDAREALARLLTSSWSLLAESAAVLTAAQAVLPPSRIRDLHAHPAQRVEDLVRRGQRDGVFRTDLPLTWLVNVIHHVLHGMVDETRSGRVTDDEAPQLATTTIQAILTPVRAPTPD